MKTRFLRYLIIPIVMIIAFCWMATEMTSFAQKKTDVKPEVKNSDKKPSSPSLGEGSEYFPLQQGNWWIYGKTGQDPDAPEITVKVTGKTKVEGVDCFIYETSIGKRINRRDYLEQRPGEGIYSIKREVFTGKGVKEFFPQPPDLLLKFPLKTGSSWEWDDDSVQQLKGFNIFEITGYEIVRTDAGDFLSFRLEVYQENIRGDKLKTVRWFAKGVGMVRETTIFDSRHSPSNTTTGVTFILKKFGILQPQ